MTARRAGFSKLNSMVWQWKAKAKEAIFISSQSRFFRAHSHQLQSEGSRNMSKKKVLHQFSLHVAFLSIVTVSLGAHVLPGKPITIPPYLSPPCNAAYPENCPKPVYPNSTRPCNEANRCRIRPLFLLDGSGTQFLAWLFVEGSPLNLINAVLANATTVAFDRWLASTSAMKNGSSVKKGASFSLSRIDTTSAGLRDEELILNFSTTVKDLG
ncbi:uncharacterized protein LOC111310311 isoform X2 [Durio zibethinus]|uniref:Uncharacterized protein LOC111310311 isoform X2 n=1 Tax=Durio zibethinus TaxID=66656 RepID=A0A6P6AKH2_DURZI|nr:uncharacterized protein LOC111310311 isoform X2 [Durio zibethinus]